MEEISGDNRGEPCGSGTGALCFSSSTCPLCHDLDNEDEEIESRNICGRCNFLLMEDLDSSDLFGMRTRYRTSDSVDSMASHDFSQMNGQSRGLVFSDNESNSLYGESESDATSFRIHGALPSDTNSISTNGGNSDDGCNSENLFRLSDESDIEEETDTDIDIDPMNVGPILWSSDDEFEGAAEDGSHWEDADIIEGNLIQPSSSRSHLHMSSSFDDMNIHLTSRRQTLTFRQRIIDSFDYTEAMYHPDIRGFEQRSRKRVAASASFVSRLPQTVIEEDNQESTACAICKDPFTIGAHVKQLPCFHIYHPCCILPWLSCRNTCPLCRHELPTEQDFVTSVVTYIADEPRAVISSASSNQGPVAQIGRNRLLFIAAPVLGLLGISLICWLGGGNPLPKRRFRVRNLTSSHRLWWSSF